MEAQVTSYYDLLEVKPTASVAEIRKAYFRLAKLYHPDRQAQDDAQSTEMFLAVQEAYDVLSDAKRRLEYDESQAAGGSGSPDSSPPPKASSAIPAASGKTEAPAKRRGPTLEEEKDARMGFMKAEGLLEQGQYDQARRVMDAVVRTVPDHPDYLSIAGYLQALAGGERLHRARDLCQKAVQAQPFNALFLARLGFVYEEVGLQSRADLYYDKALAKDPRQALASSRRRGGSSSRAGGLLGSIRRIFGG